MSLRFEDIYRLIELLPQSKTITLIGGQALNFWAELYFHDDPDFCASYGPFTSMDIDFLGGKDEIIECAAQWGGRPKLAEPFGFSPNSGIVVVPLHSGENLIVDFLSSVHGLTENDIFKHRIKVQYRNAEFYVIHPLHCLKSKIANVIGLSRNDSVSLDRVQVAIAIVKRRIRQLIERGRRRQALDEIESVFRLACDHMLGVQLFLKYDLQVFDAVPKDPRLGEMFLTRRYAQMEQNLKAKLKKRTR